MNRWMHRTASRDIAIAVDNRTEIPMTNGTRYCAHLELGNAKEIRKQFAPSRFNRRRYQYYPIATPHLIGLLLIDDYLIYCKLREDSERPNSFFSLMMGIQLDSNY